MASRFIYRLFGVSSLAERRNDSVRPMERRSFRLFGMLIYGGLISSGVPGEITTDDVSGPAND